MAEGVPPGWPGAVRPPGSAGWERSVVAWLLDLCPADYRGHAVLVRHPLALTHLAGLHVEADLTALRQARSTARTAIGTLLEPRALTEFFEAVDVEEARLLGARRGVTLIDAALRGHRHVPRL